MKAKIQMLEALADIEIAMKIIARGGAGDANPVDGQYESLNCGLEPLDQKHADFNVSTFYAIQFVHTFQIKKKLIFSHT